MEDISRERYEKELADRQRDHLQNVYKNGYVERLQPSTKAWKPCLHNDCNECHGTGVKIDGTACIHMISCNCPKCTPYSM
jgi:hypothetical protein